MARPKNTALCSVENCKELVYSKGMCRPHWWRMFKYGRTHKIIGLIKGNCIIENCDKKIKGHGLCKNHYGMLNTYGIHPNEYYKLLEKQNNKCFICNEEETSTSKGKLIRLSIDHCHKTNQIRKLLCHRCNQVIGRVNEDVELLKKMIDYLQFHNVKI